MVPGLVQHQHSAHHRFPVWWTGDGVTLEASVESMVDSGIYDFKPYVHSDCGGDYRPTEGGDLLRWTEHCTFGTIFRYHGAEHQPWSYDTHTEDVIRSYLNIRYAFIPSLIAAAHVATLTAFPIVARCDLFFSENLPYASDNHQYLFLNDTLVAPIWDSTDNVTIRSVWIPPGQWQDAWSGEMVIGPQNISVAQPYERIPLWHQEGGLIVMASNPGIRVDRQDWSSLTLQAFPAINRSVVVHRTVYPQNDATLAGKNTHLMMETTDDGWVVLTIDPEVRAMVHHWVLRVHLAVDETMTELMIDEEPSVHKLHLIAPTLMADVASFMPFGGPGTAPAPKAGPIAEILVPGTTGQCRVSMRVVLGLE